MVRAVRFRSDRKSTRQYSTATGSHPLLTQYQVPTYALELEELSGHGLWFDGACGPLPIGTEEHTSIQHSNWIPSVAHSVPGSNLCAGTGRIKRARPLV